MFDMRRSDLGELVPLHQATVANIYSTTDSLALPRWSLQSGYSRCAAWTSSRPKRFDSLSLHRPRWPMDWCSVLTQGTTARLRIGRRGRPTDPPLRRMDTVRAI